VSGVAMLAASTLAGLLWDRFGASQTFLVGTVFSALALVAIACRPSE
jgi:predicted MFS family arabinose efflux permease